MSLASVFDLKAATPLSEKLLAFEEPIELRPVLWSPRLGWFTRLKDPDDTATVSPEFSLGAIRKLKKCEVPVIQGSRDLDVGKDIFQRWLKEFSSDPG